MAARPLGVFCFEGRALAVNTMTHLSSVIGHRSSVIGHWSLVPCWQLRQWRSQLPMLQVPKDKCPPAMNALVPTFTGIRELFSMIVVMEQGATAEQIRHMAERVESLGLKAHIIQGTERTVIAAIGEKRDGTRESLASGPGVESVMPILAPYKVASREVKKEPTQVSVRNLRVGAGHVGIIAGPCSVESEPQILASARAVKAAGGTALRGGAFEPRTSPYSFQGLKEEGLKLLALARQETGLAIVTEVMSTEEVELVAQYADVLQVGARNMQNYRLLEAVGQARKPVLLKRGPSATI